MAATTTDDVWFDPERQRGLPVRLRWPDGQGPCGLIVHSHGLGGNRAGGDAWGQAWRDAGFAVVHLQHPGSDNEVLRQGLSALRAAASAEQLRARVADMRFAADEIGRRAQRGEGAWSRVRLDALGASGHSFGAVTVQAIAGQRFATFATSAGSAQRSDEPRFKAVVALSPSPGQGLPPRDAFATVTRPFLAITGSLDSDALGRGLTGAERAAVVDALPRGHRALLWLDGADHMTFAGNAHEPLRARWGPLARQASAAEREPRHHRHVAAVTTLWWRAHLHGDAAAQAALRAPVELDAGDRWRMD